MPKMDEVTEHLQLRCLELSGLLLFRAEKKPDRRGYVLPVYNKHYFESIGIVEEFVHENHCWSPKAGTVRGFHYQLPPYGQAKLIRVTRGRILDVNVDLRQSSPTFGCHAKAELSVEGWNQIFVPEGYAHCYCTLDDDTDVIFKLGSYYAPSHARGLVWNDPELNVDWPITETEAIVLERDRRYPGFSKLTELFP